MIDEHSGGAATRVILLRDISGIGEDEELGAHTATRLGIVIEVDDNGEPKIVEEGFPQPRNWHSIESDDPLVPNAGVDSLKDRRIGVALISDHEHDFSGFQLGPPPPGNPFGNDWAFDQRSTRVIDYHDPQGDTALFSQLAKVADDPLQQFSLAIPVGPTIAGHRVLPPDDDPDAGADGGEAGRAAQLDPAGHGGDAAAGLFWDGKRLGMMATMLAPVHIDDVEGSGLRGTDHGWQGVRRTMHFEWGEKHGSLRISKHNLPEREGRGPIFSASLRHMPSAKNNPGDHETGQWAPYYRAVYFTPEDETTTDEPTDHVPPGSPGGPGDTIGGPSAPDGTVVGGSDVVPPYGPFDDPATDPTPTPVVLIIPGLTRDGILPTPIINLLGYISPHEQLIFGGLTGEGVDSDRSVIYCLQGEDTANQFWGLTLAPETQIGAEIADNPLIRWGHESDDVSWEMQALGSLGNDGNITLAPLNAVGGLASGQQFNVGSSFHVQEAGSPDYFSYNATDHYWEMPLGSTADVAPAGTARMRPGATGLEVSYDGDPYQAVPGGGSGGGATETAGTTWALLGAADAYL